MTGISKTTSRTARLLLIGCSSLALSVPAAANDVIFSSNGSDPQAGERTSQTGGVTQIALSGGGTASIVDAADYTVNSDGSIELHEGSVTVAGDPSKDVVVRMPEGLEGRVTGRNSSANFTVSPEGDASGHALTGSVRVKPRNRDFSSFPQGSMWRSSGGGGPKRVLANDPVAQPDSAPAASPAADEVVAIGGDAGPVNAALNGIPVTLGDALAAAGASSDIIAAGRRVEASVGNPILETFPTGDLALLVAAAARLEGVYGGRPFNAAQADVIRTYLRFLANGGAGADFLAAYSGFALGYLDLIRAGGVPSGFSSGVATAADVDAYLAFIARTGALANLAARDRILADAYLAFLASGGNRDLFAASFTDLTEAYFAFIRAGGTPSDFTGASEAALAESIAFLQNSGLVAQLSAADQALVAAFLQNGGIAFAAQFETALDDYFAFLAAGRLPSDYTVLDQATLRAYLETLSNTGLLETVLADQAQFYADYLAFLRGGGDIDAFAGLPANIFAGYAVQLNSYFTFLAAGNLPTQFSASDAAQLQAFIQELRAAGALDRFLTADQATFFASFAQFVAEGGAFNDFAGLNANIFAGYAVDLQAYFDFLSNGGIPSAYTVLSQDTIEEYLAALAAAGATDRFLLDLAEFYTDYFQFVLGGGNPDNFAGLPVPPDFPAFAAALNAYAAFLTANGLPSDYTDEDIALLQTFFNSVLESGQLNDLLGENAALLNAYFVFLSNGGGIDEFAGLPVFADYVVQLNAYFAFLNAGGFPADYDVVDQATLNAFLAALSSAEGGLAGFGDLDAFFAQYAAFVLGGGDPVNFTGLPVYAQYVAALNAYFDFLAAGNLPSEYTVFDTATLEAFLAALARLQGGLGGFADLNDFFVDYFAFLQDGGDPDLFADLPGDRVINVLGDINGWQFAADGLRVARVDAKVDDDGRITELTVFNPSGVTTDYSDRDDDLREFGRIGNDVAWTRYFVGAANRQDNVSEHLLVGAPATNIPATGTLQYNLVGGTAPTNRNDELGSVASFTGELGVAFGASAQIGFNFDLLSRTEGYRVSTAGGAADPSSSGVFVDGNGRFESQFTAITRLTDTTCTGFCQAQIFGGLFGDGGTSAGFTFNVFDRSANNSLQGVAIFAADGTPIDGLGTPPDNGGGTGTPIVLTDTRGIIGYPGVAFSAIGRGEFELGGNGFPTRYSAGSSINGTVVDPGPATESGSVRDTISWTRWESGDITASFGRTTETRRLANVHVITGSPATNVPTTGIVDFELIGSTKPSDGNGLFGPVGTFDGALAIDFATLRVGLDFDVTADIYGWNVSTAGGAADPNDGGLLVVANGASAFQGGATVTGLTSASCLVRCTAIIGGNFHGDGVSHVGVGYSISDQITVNGSQALINAQGVAAFANTGVRSGGGDMGGGNTGGTGFTGTREGQVFYTYTGGSLATAFGGSANFVNGEVTGLVSGLGTVTSNDTTIVEAGDLETIAWARWTDGAVLSESSVLGNTEVVVGPNDGYHVFTGSVTQTLPSGTIAYELVGGTSPTDNAGSAPGSLTGDLAIAFGTVSRVGFDLTMDVGGRSWGVSTQGGAANPQNSDTNLVRSSGIWSFTSTFNSVLENVTATGGACAATCNVSVGGTLYGDNADFIGLAMNVTDFDGTATRGVSGVAIFGQEGAATSAAAQTQSTASIAPSVAPIASLDWGRWGGTAGATPQGGGGAGAPPSVDPIAAMQRGSSGRDVPTAAHARAIEQAERLMGGTITWGDSRLQR